ncbi:helix-turn-helix domain-containing protein [Saccharopolyspora spinosa]|uniref:helix-turn-helix domain-containing protein n=1 Tax=Saccharopolyspora spinosa TaxID=60894 RepID=UPI0002378E83|nr:helix-turn-helix transcriptional regulator [Saccharopolyspora spinosa]
MATANGPRARALAAALRQARQEQNMSIRELGRKLSFDQSNLSKIENCKKVPSIELTARILGALGAKPDECERILALARRASEPNWLAVGIPGLPEQLAGAMESEREAKSIVDWAPMTLPGLLQTTDYVRALAETNELPKHEIERRVTVRIARREILTRQDPLKLEALISEVAFREPMASPDVMIEQLRHLLIMADRPNVEIRVIPRGVGWHPGSAGPFILYEFSDAPAFVHFEHYSSGAFVTNSDDVEAYRMAIDTIKRHALNPVDSKRFIAQVIVDDWSASD